MKWKPDVGQDYDVNAVVKAIEETPEVIKLFRDWKSLNDISDWIDTPGGILGFAEWYARKLEPSVQAPPSGGPLSQRWHRIDCEAYNEASMLAMRLRALGVVLAEDQSSAE